MKKFTHLSYEERVAISFLQAEGWSARKIGAKLGRHHSCITYELKKKVKVCMWRKRLITNHIGEDI